MYSFDFVMGSLSTDPAAAAAGGGIPVALSQNEYVRSFLELGSAEELFVRLQEKEHFCNLAVLEKDKALEAQRQRVAALTGENGRAQHDIQALEAQIGALLYIVGSFVAALSPMLWGVVLGLFMYGLAVGFAMHVAPLYIAEISPADIRGTLVSAKEAIIVFGMFLGFFTGWVFSSLSSDGWRLMILCGGFMATAMFCGVCYVPQSPRYLVLMAARRGNGAGEEEEALAALTFLRGGASDEAKDELRGLRSDVETSLRSDREVDGLLQKKGAQEMGALAAFAYPTPLIVGCGVVILQQITGQPSVLYYATNVFKSAGFGDSSSQQSVLLGPAWQKLAWPAPP